MSTGIILGLGLLAIVVSFYIILNIPYWILLIKKKNESNLKIKKKYHEWAYTSDDALNKSLKIVIYSLYIYGSYVFLAEIWSKYQ